MPPRSSVDKCPKCGWRLNQLYERHNNKMAPVGVHCKSCGYIKVK